MSMTKQWEARGDSKLEIPAELQKKLRYKLIYHLGGATMVAWCGKYRVRGAEVTLHDAVTDTSHRYQGIMLTKRLTYRPLVYLVNVPVTIFPLDNEEVNRNDHDEPGARE